MKNLFTRLIRFGDMYVGHTAQGVVTVGEWAQSAADEFRSIVDELTSPGVVDECSWAYISPRTGWISSTYFMRWVDAPSRSGEYYAASLGPCVPKKTGSRCGPALRTFELFVTQGSVPSDEGVCCGLEFRVTAHHRPGEARIECCFDLWEMFPHAVRLHVVDGDSLPDEFDMYDYPLSPMLRLFDVVRETVIAERV